MTDLAAAGDRDGYVLQLVFRDGRDVTKVGPYDGHLTNSAAYADDELDGVVELAQSDRDLLVGRPYP
ncbi:hypothetical protein ACPZ19_45000 [Amycolatopsis lurida]